LAKAVAVMKAVAAASTEPAHLCILAQRIAIEPIAVGHERQKQESPTGKQWQ
jgi:hypothetical protein